MINAKIICDSIAKNGKRLTTFELEYPRFIHSEFMTHRMLSKNSASSRAIPLKTMLGLVWNTPASPIHWGKNQSGMQAAEQLFGARLFLAKSLWNISGKVACIFAWLVGKAGIHKQISNRIIEPWSHIKVVASATDWDNFFNLRNHKDAQPEIHELARQMWDLYKNGKPKLLNEGEWHLPYVETDFAGKFGGGLEEAKKLSSSLCAQLSYRRFDESIGKALKIYDRLVKSEPIHASPFEHQATPHENENYVSGNFRGWKQYRQEIPNNVCLEYKERA
jgi:hypothetical protein